MKQPKFNVKDRVYHKDSSFVVNAILFVDEKFYYSSGGKPDTQGWDLKHMPDGIVEDYFYDEDYLELIEDKDETS